MVYTISKNVQHAVNTHLNSRSKTVKTVHVETKKEVIYINQANAAKKLNFYIQGIGKHIKSGLPYKNLIFTILN